MPFNIGSLTLLITVNMKNVGKTAVLSYPFSERAKMEIKGYTYGFMGKPGAYRSADGIKSQELLYETGINWLCLAVAVYQDTYHSTKMTYDYSENASDMDVFDAIKRAHERNVKVCLKPMVNCRDGVWRALIDFPDEDMHGRDIYWSEWFKNYTAFLLHYAEIAEYTKCEMFCIGCEMLGTERKEKYWRELIKKVRKVYHGPLVYNTNHGKEEVAKWYDAIDYIGTSAYYPVTGHREQYDRETMVAEWKKISSHLAQVSGRLNKKIIFMEIGCRSARGCADIPWDFSHTDLPKDDAEQADFYDSCIEVMHDEPWFAGFFWWDWSTRIYDTIDEAAEDRGFNIHLKKAEDVIKKWYKQ